MFKYINNILNRLNKEIFTQKIIKNGKYLSTIHQKSTTTGALKLIPICKNSIELLKYSKKCGFNYKYKQEKTNKMNSDELELYNNYHYNNKILKNMTKLNKNNLKNSRTYTAKYTHLAISGVTRYLGDLIKQYHLSIKNLHPFELSLVDLTVMTRIKKGLISLNDIISELKLIRKDIYLIGRKYAPKCSKARTPKDAFNYLKECMNELEIYLFDYNTEFILSSLIQIQRDLKKLPIVRLDLPTIVLIGAPNVGKSSIVRSFSTGVPEVNNYPFTTRGMSLGHFLDDDGDQCQMMDTPGLLIQKPIDNDEIDNNININDDPDYYRNEMEKMTIASMKYLNTAIIYVIDLSGKSGIKSNIKNQLIIRDEIIKRFKNKNRYWIDIISKCDLPYSNELNEDNDLKLKVDELIKNSYLFSAKTAHNYDIIDNQIKLLLKKLKSDIILEQEKHNNNNNNNNNEINNQNIDLYF